MYLRKLWSAKLAEWLFGTGVAIGCLAPIGTNVSASGGFLGCIGSSMMECYDDNTGLPCSVLAGDGSDDTMWEACGTTLGAPGGAWPTGSNWKCGAGCNNGAEEGAHCSVNTQNCYY
jgi:hypothetical protein